MNVSPTICVITVNLNNLAGLARTWESVVTQSRPADQWIIADGKSVDGSAEFLRSRTPPSGTTISIAPDMGIYYAMNAALDKVRTDYVIFMNSGDTFDSDASLLLIRNRLQMDRPLWAYGDARIGSARTGWRLHSLRHLAYLRLHCGLGTVPHQAVVADAELVRNLGGFDTDVGSSADQELLVRMWMGHNPVYLDQVVARCEPGGVGSSGGTGAWARQMRYHRKRLQIEYPFAVDGIVTVAAVTFDLLKSSRPTRG